MCRRFNSVLGHQLPSLSSVSGLRICKSAVDSEPRSGTIWTVPSHGGRMNRPTVSLTTSNHAKRRAFLAVLATLPFASARAEPARPDAVLVARIARRYRVEPSAVERVISLAENPRAHQTAKRSFARSRRATYPPTKSRSLVRLIIGAVVRIAHGCDERVVGQRRSHVR